MNEQTSNQGDTEFHNVVVTITNAGGKPTVNYAPPSVQVKTHNAVICYQLAAAPQGFVFFGAKILPMAPHQFNLGRITADGRMLTFEDINNIAAGATYNMWLMLMDGTGATYPTDPQIINKPG